MQADSLKKGLCIMFFITYQFKKISNKYLKQKFQMISKYQIFTKTKKLTKIAVEMR